MNPLKHFLLFSVLGIGIFSACSKEDEFAPYLKGDIIGYAYCADEFGNELDDFSGIRVYTEPKRNYSAITDKNGRYVLEDVINGTYNLSFEKEGFGTMKMFGIQHLGGKPTILSYYYDDEYVIIFENITTHIVALHYQNDSLIADLSLSGTESPTIIFMRLFFSTLQNFDIQSAEASKSIDLWNRGRYFESYEGNVSDELPFASGQTIYCKAAIYSDDRYVADGTFPTVGPCLYYDPSKETIVFPNLSDETAEFSFIMP